MSPESSGAGPSCQVELITELSDTDLEELCEAAEEAIENGGGFGWLKPPSRHTMESYWRGALLVPERKVFVARLEGTICGSAQMVRPPRNNEAQAFSASIIGTFIAPWARRHGLGRLLVQAIEAEARALRIGALNLDLRETQKAAVQLYASLGFKRWGTHPIYARVDGTTIAGYYYLKRLDGDTPDHS